MAGRPVFDPARHPRDRFGRFTKSRTVKATTKDKTAARKTLDGFAPKTTADRAGYLREIQPAGQQKAIADYTLNAKEINQDLRAGHADAAGVQPMDDAMAPLPDDVVLFRTVPQAAFGGLDVTGLAGMKVRDAGFTATQFGTVPPTADVRMHIAAPAGTKAVLNPDTGEVVLDRDLEMVVAKVEPNTAGGHDMYLTVLPKTTTGTKPAAVPHGAGVPAGADKVRSDLMKLNVPALQAQMRERGLRPGRKRKSQLVDALVADETGNDSPDSSPGDSPDSSTGVGSGPTVNRAAPQPGSDARSDTVRTGAAALAAAPAGLHRAGSGLPADATSGLAAYQDGRNGSDYKKINGALRSGSTGDDATSKAIAGIDTAMAVSGLTGDVTAHRGIRNARSMFGDRVDEDMTGLRWREDGFVSTSTDPNAIRNFSRGTDGVDMRISVPAGSSAVDLSDPGDPGEAELLLDRGHEFEVVADRGMVGGTRQLDVRVLPKQASPARETKPSAGDSVAAQSRVGAALQPLTLGKFNRAPGTG